MCGRFTLTTPGPELAERFGIASAPALEARYNVAPSQPIVTVREAGSAAARVLEMRRWGLVPAWAADARAASQRINARAESVATRPAYREAFRRRRCLVPMNGFFEWRRQARGSSSPFLVRPVSQALFAVAGLWERWRSPGGELLESCTLLTAPSLPVLQPIHDRMPLVLSPADYDAWLDPSLCDTARLRPLLQAPADLGFECVAVGPRVNDPRCDDPSCLAPAPQLALDLGPAGCASPPRLTGTPDR
jgi:putative SOS response-associated peptidase YedK